MKRLAILLTLTACATPPEKIAAVPMSGAEYSGQSCEQLIAAKATSTQSLAKLTKQQKDAVTGDAVGVLLIGVPVSSATGGDRETAIAVEKGRLAAIEGAIGGRC